MYSYLFSLKFAKKRANISFKGYIDIIKEAIENVNHGLVFRRDRKEMNIDHWNDTEMFIKLQSREKLTNPVRSLSGITRYLMKFHSETFDKLIYNKIIFTIILISQEIKSTEINTDLSNEELMKGMIDLLYSYTSTSNAETISRNKTIEQMKSLIAPYIKK